MPSPRSPIIVLGANHSGTRLLVDLLEAMGSAAGRAGNEWREEATFLDLHRKLIGLVSDKGWDATIFDLEFARHFQDDGDLVPVMRQWIEERATEIFPPRDGRPWHWKCPTAIFFLPSWLEIFPDAVFVHVERDPVEVARSLLRRREVPRLADGVHLCRLMNDRVLACRPRMERYLHLQLERIGGSLAELAAFAELSPTPAQLEAASGKIKPTPRRLWHPQRSVRWNLREHHAALAAMIYRLSHKST